MFIMLLLQTIKQYEREMEKKREITLRYLPRLVMFEKWDDGKINIDFRQISLSCYFSFLSFFFFWKCKFLLLFFFCRRNEHTSDKKTEKKDYFSFAKNKNQYANNKLSSFFSSLNGYSFLFIVICRIEVSSLFARKK